MEKKSKAHTDLGIPDSELESLARVLLPLMQEYLMSEEGQRDYAEWTAQKQLNSKYNDKKSPIESQRTAV